MEARGERQAVLAAIAPHQQPDRAFGRDMNAVGLGRFDQRRDLRRVRQREPQIRIARHRKGAKRLRRQEADIDAEALGGFRHHGQRAHHPVDLGMPRIGRDQDMRHAARAATRGTGASRALRIGPGDDFEPAVLVLDERGAAFDPVAAVHVADAVLVADRGVVDMAADHAIGAVPPRFAGQGLFERADIVHRVLDLQLRPLRQRPIGHAEHAPEEVDQAVHLNGEVIGLVAEMGEPARVLHHEIEDVAVDDEIALAVGALVDGVFHHVDAAEMRAVIVAQELVVVARHVDDLGALARLAQHLLHEVVVRLRPVPARLQRPAVDDIADEIDGVGVVAF